MPLARLKRHHLSRTRWTCSRPPQGARGIAKRRGACASARPCADLEGIMASPWIGVVTGLGRNCPSRGALQPREGVFALWRTPVMGILAVLGCHWVGGVVKRKEAREKVMCRSSSDRRTWSRPSGVDETRVGLHLKAGTAHHYKWTSSYVRKRSMDRLTYTRIL